jgi:hypothetical protein
VSPKQKITEDQGVGARSLARNTLDDALPIPGGTQMGVPNRKQQKSKDSSTLPGSQHFEGVEGRARDSGWD